MLIYRKTDPRFCLIGPVNKPYLQSYTLWLTKALFWPTINIAVDARLAQSRPLDLEFKTDWKHLVITMHKIVCAIKTQDFPLNSRIRRKKGQKEQIKLNNHKTFFQAWIYLSMARPVIASDCSKSSTSSCSLLSIREGFRGSKYEICSNKGKNIFMPPIQRRTSWKEKKTDWKKL